MADQVQRVVVLAVPVVRTLARGARFTRVPWVLVASTAFSIASTLRAGVREVQVIGSLIAHRIEQETGRPAAPRLVKRLALELYLTPRRTPSTTDSPLPLRRLLQRWLFKGAFGRDTRRAASKALDAAEKLDVRPYVDSVALARRRRPPSPPRPQRRAGLWTKRHTLVTKGVSLRETPRSRSIARARASAGLPTPSSNYRLTLGRQKETSP